MTKKLIFIVAMAAALCMLGGCSQTTAKDVQETAEDVAKEVADQVENIADSEEDHVLSVKNGHLEQYPENPIGEAFDNFFGSPTWKYFKGTDTGGNGESINDTEHNVDVVEFTGYCTYQDVEVKARLQFILNEDGTFTTGALSFNDVPQSQLITAAMMEKIFEQNMQDKENASDNGMKATSDVMELTDYMGTMSTDFYNQSGLELEVYGTEGWDYSGYENGIDVSEVRDASGYYVTLTSRQLGDKQVSLIGIMVGDSYDDVKSFIESDAASVSDTTAYYQLDNGDTISITFDSKTKIISQIMYGHYSQKTEVPEDTISVYDAAGRYESDSLSLSISIYSEEAEDASVGVMAWKDCETGKMGEAILYKNTNSIVAFEWKGMSYYMSFTENGAIWCDLSDALIMQFEKTESYQS